MPLSKETLDLLDRYLSRVLRGFQSGELDTGDARGDLKRAFTTQADCEEAVFQSYMLASIQDENPPVPKSHRG
jgi:hypothetical protein